MQSDNSNEQAIDFAEFGFGGQRSESTDFEALLSKFSEIFHGILLNPTVSGVTSLNLFGARFGAHLFTPHATELHVGCSRRVLF